MLGTMTDKGIRLKGKIRRLSEKTEVKVTVSLEKSPKK